MPDKSLINYTHLNLPMTIFYFIIKGISCIRLKFSGFHKKYILKYILLYIIIV